MSSSEMVMTNDAVPAQLPDGTREEIDRARLTSWYADRAFAYDVCRSVDDTYEGMMRCRGDWDRLHPKPVVGPVRRGRGWADVDRINEE
jgi:hypothetical protein